jgi:hypothetical protein
MAIYSSDARKIYPVCEVIVQDFVSLVLNILETTQCSHLSGGYLTSSQLRNKPSFLFPKEGRRVQRLRLLPLLPFALARRRKRLAITERTLSNQSD